MNAEARALQAQIHAALDAIVPARTVGIRSRGKFVEVLHPTKGWRRLVSFKRLGIA